MGRSGIRTCIPQRASTWRVRMGYDRCVTPVGRNSGGREFRVSATLFTTYLRCPQQAVARASGIYPEYSKAAFRGGLAHSIFARHLVDGPIPKSDFAAACREQAGSDLGNAMASLSMKPSEFKAITAEVEELYDRFRNVSTDGFDGAEVPIEYRTDDGTEFRGRIDAVYVSDGGVRIVDWKTGSSLDDAVPQLDFYAMMWLKAYDELPGVMEALSLKTGEQRISHPTQQSVRETEVLVSNMVDAIGSALAEPSELARTAGPYCRWCPILDGCGEGTAALKILD